MTNHNKLEKSVDVDDKEILLNIMFTGSYLESNNIGHEAINLFKDDNGKNYIYVLPYGTMDKKHNNKKVKTVLFVRRHNSIFLEILAKAEGLEQIAKVNTTRNKEIEQLIEAQSTFINDNNVTYEGVKINNIFDDNDNRNGKIQPVYITFSAEEVTKVKQPIYITIDSDKKSIDATYYKVMTGIYKFPSQSPKMYISEKNNSQAYKKLEKIIDDNRYWGETTKKLTYYHKYRNTNLDSYNIIDIMKKDHDELCYSNLLQHFFSVKPKIFKKFAKKVLNITNLSENYKILREWKNIDILIDDKENKNVIVIENKIKSGINGVEDRHNIGSDLVQSQLKTYYEYVVNGIEYKKNNLVDIDDKENNKYKEYTGKYFFIFAPDYNHINLKNYDCGKLYTLIEYSKIFKFFEEYKEELKEVPYFKEFLYALQKHTKPIDNSNEEEMMKRFLAKIKSKK